MEENKCNVEENSGIPLFATILLAFLLTLVIGLPVFFVVFYVLAFFVDVPLGSGIVLALFAIPLSAVVAFLLSLVLAKKLLAKYGKSHA